MNHSPADILRSIEHTLLRPESTPSEIDRLCDEAVEFGLGAVCVNPCHVKRAADRLATARTTASTSPAPFVVSVAGFPLGANHSATKADEALRILEEEARKAQLAKAERERRAKLKADKARRKAKEKAEEKAIANRNKEIERYFSAWNGSCTSLVKLLKENLHDPSSFKHVKTVYWDNKDHLIIKMDYRAKNGFGALRLSYVKAKLDLKAGTITIIENK